MKQNIEKNIKYILDNIDDLDLSPIDKEYIDRIVKYLKFQVKYNQIYTNLIENEKLVKQIENTIKLLATQNEKLNKEIETKEKELIFTYDDYVPLENNKDIFASLQAKVEEARKKAYEEKKEEAEKEFELQKPEIEQELKMLQNQQENIMALREQISSPEYFINSILNDELNIPIFNNNYKSLINECSKSILDEDFETDKKFLLFDYNDNENIYEPKKENLKIYFDYARDPELANELSEFYKKLNDIKLNKNIAEIKEESSEKKLSQREDLREALYDKFEQKNIENSIYDIFVLINKLKDEIDKKNETNKYSDIPSDEKKINQITKLFGKFKKNEDETKTDEIKEQENQDVKCLDVKETFNELIESFEKLKSNTDFENNPKASLIYEFYLNIAKTKIGDDIINSNKKFLKSFDIQVEEKILDEICLLYTFICEYTFEDIHNIISQIIDDKVDEAQNLYTLDKKDLTDAEIDEKNLLDNLSDEAKKYHEKFGTKFSLNKFNELSDNSDVCSPLVASLVLEIIFNIDKVKTPEEISKFGIKFTEEDIKEYKKEIENTIIPNIENFLTNSMNYIIIKRS